LYEVPRIGKFVSRRQVEGYSKKVEEKERMGVIV
jgi:hypothetical protein